MDELVREVLNEYFADFKEYHLLILVGFTLVIALLQIIQSVLITKKIERFKNVLKKSEIKFSKYNQLQIEALGEIYPLLAGLLLNTITIQHDMKTASPEKTKSMTDDWGQSFNDILKIYLEKRYILNKRVQDEYGILMDKLTDLNSYLKTERDFSALFATLSDGTVEFMGNEEDRVELEGKRSIYNADSLINDTINRIKILRSEIDDYFSKIE